MNIQKRLLAVFFTATSAHAATDSGLDQLLSLSLEDLMATKVRISTSTEQPLTKAPSVVSIITADDIKATGATNVMEILQSVPGIYVRANLFSFRSQVTFRGANGTHTLLMVNGEPIRDLVWSAGIFSKGFPTSMVERIEIIRGPGSALFGSDASAGVINIITKTAAGIDHAEAGARAGSFDTHAGWAQFGGNWNGLDVALTADLSDTDGHDPFIARDRNGISGHAGYSSDNQDLRFSAGIGNWRLLADHTHRGNVGTGLSGFGVLDPRTRASDSRSDLALIFNNAEFAPDWGLNAEVRYYDLSYSSGNGFFEEPPGYVSGGSVYPDGQINLQRADQRGYSMEVSGLYAGLRTHAIRIGGGHKLDDLYFVEHQVNFGTGPNGITLPAGGPLVDISGTPYAFAPEKSRRINYFFLQDVWTIANDWELTAGLRRDNYSDFGGTTNPRLALVWQSTDKLVTKLMYGKAFRVPSYLERYSQTSTTLPNSSLKPERSETWDLAFSYSASRDLKLGIDFYRFVQKDLIINNASTGFQYQNGGDNTTRGIELEAQWQATHTLRISGNLTTRAETQLINSAPKQKAYLRADWSFMPNWNWDVQATHAGRRFASATSATGRLDPYTLVDSTIRYSHDRHWEFAASVRNLLDADAREYSSSLTYNLPLPNRSLYGEVRYKF
jgi:iron complex outermembrane receptor protein